MINLYKQEKKNWCWAASIQMVLKDFGISKTQSQIVEIYDNLYPYGSFEHEFGFDLDTLIGRRLPSYDKIDLRNRDHDFIKNLSIIIEILSLIEDFNFQILNYDEIKITQAAIENNNKVIALIKVSTSGHIVVVDKIFDKKITLRNPGKIIDGTFNWEAKIEEMNFLDDGNFGENELNYSIYKYLIISKITVATSF